MHVSTCHSTRCSLISLSLPPQGPLILLDLLAAVTIEAFLFALKDVRHQDHAAIVAIPRTPSHTSLLPSPANLVHTDASVCVWCGVMWCGVVWCIELICSEL
jgi:hypothetical protein